MKKVTGIGGIFFKSRNPEKLKSWYEKHLGIEASDEAGAIFEWRDADDPDKSEYTVWGPFPRDTDYFQPSNASFMINYRVQHLEELIDELREAGLDVSGPAEHPEGIFAWVMDPEGNKIELWEPVADA